MQNLGMIGLKSRDGAYLQAHTDGELHASNMHRNEEETWFLIEVDKVNHIYALSNWRTGRFISKSWGVGCAPATGVLLGVPEQWTMISGTPYGFPNAVALKSVRDGTFLGANHPGDDDPYCHGEVNAAVPDGPYANADWGGWWVPEAAKEPSPGSDVWNTIGGAITGIANSISPVDVAVLIASL
jgi:hypothetical protein